MTYTEPSYRQRITFGQSNNAVTRLIVINLVVFISIALTKVFYYYTYRTDAEVDLHFNAEVIPLAALPASLSDLLYKPWTVLTSMFTHIGVWMTLANMLWLWTFGYIMQDLTGNRKIVPLYIYGGLAGAIGFLLAVNLLPANTVHPAATLYYGGAASITAIAIATTVVSPGQCSSSCSQYFLWRSRQHYRHCRCRYRGFARVPHFPTAERRIPALDTDRFLPADFDCHPAFL